MDERRLNKGFSNWVILVILLYFILMKLIIENANDRGIELMPVVVSYIEDCLEVNEQPAHAVSIWEDIHEVYVSIIKNKKSYRILFHH